VGIQGPDEAASGEALYLEGIVDDANGFFEDLLGRAGFDPSGVDAHEVRPEAVV